MNFKLLMLKKVFKNINKTPYLVLIDGETITGNNNDVTNLSFQNLNSH